jgi:hypothetical protein
MNNNWLFNETINKKIGENSFIIDKENIKKREVDSDIKIDYNIFFTGILDISDFKELDKSLEDNNYDYNFKKFIFLNYVEYRNKNLVKNKAILANIIYKNFNIKNDEISYIFKSLSKKNILERIKDYF